MVREAKDSSKETLTDAAAKIYQQYLAKLKLPIKVLTLQDRKKAFEILPGTNGPTYLLWVNGEDILNIGTSTRTFTRNRHVIKQRLPASQGEHHASVLQEEKGWNVQSGPRTAIGSPITFGHRSDTSAKFKHTKKNSLETFDL